MSTVRKTITLTEQQDHWIKSQIADGHYTNDSEVLRDLIRKAQVQSREIEAIREALIEGEKSGMSDRTPRQIMQDVKARKRNNGEL